MLHYTKKNKEIIVHIIFLFALIQGFTEFLPVSSQGHLIVFNSFFNINIIANISVLEANVIAHAGSLVAVCLYYWKQLLLLLISFKHIVRPDIDKNSSLVIHLTLATIPILVCGFLFSKFFDYDNKSLFLIIGITSIFFGIINPQIKVKRFLSLSMIRDLNIFYQKNIHHFMKLEI